ncbi:MAG: universal stress protein [Verrucomicrobia bacterium]|nr:universal stress protein [Verrucomicrobiota bacterium]MBV9128811.1 universal stress protein [Verrucomicrobiota bacterium]MBV9297353.1 universal stress protein [Verrucomicrobiota bacterium]MBV9643018.1 universal stress protein [Verrucomicrobiota bacterium]
MKILVCNDGSERARRALASAAIVANATKAETTIFGIVEIEQDEPSLLRALREEATIFREQDVKLEIVTKFGDPVAEITRRTQENVYDLVVIGAERRGTQGFFLPSAKAYTITEAIDPPVLVVPVSRPTIKRILICSGGGTYIENAVRFTSKIAKDLAAEVTLLTVTPEPPAMHATIFRRQEDMVTLLNSNSALARNLRTEKEIIERAGIPAVVQIRHGIVIDQILAEVERCDYDLVVSGSWPVRDAWRNYAIGNVTRQIVNRTDRPVLVIRSNIRPATLTERLRNMVKKFGGRQDYMAPVSAG